MSAQVRPDIERNVVKIDDPFGPAITGADMQCIVASSETEAGCVRINEKRKEAGGCAAIIFLVLFCLNKQIEAKKYFYRTARARHPPDRAG